MDRFVADLHIHSRFSRATSKTLSLKTLAAWGRVKGLNVVGTGDFTHPQWLAEIEELLEEDGNGLFVLRDDSGLADEIPALESQPSGRPRFMLQTEISSIYKRGGKVRKVHNLVYMPHLDAVRSFNQKLDQIGNLASDGRPILGLDSHDLLEIVLETDPMAFLIPAHVWTPWFSLFGSKSGFDTVEECYGDLSKHIFAMETGLSSDPDMNWLWSALDKIRLISNSDAHSGEKLGREANLFQGEPSYEGIFRALRGEGLGHKFLGTIEFFPEEGKYHMDGHRKCGVIMDPKETKARGGLCPVCGKPVTRGVLARILDLADRDEPVRPQGQPGFTSLIPLKEIMSEILGVGSGTKKVAHLYNRAIPALGSELNVLMRMPAEDIKKISTPLAEGITRMRDGQVIRAPGFDGQYGVISVFTPQERERFKNGATLVDIPGKKKTSRVSKIDTKTPDTPVDPEPDTLTMEFNPDQQKAIKAGPGPVLVLAGPGTGKTQTLMGRVEHLLKSGEKPRRILVLTFTRRAAQELRERLQKTQNLDDNAPLPQAGTLHSLAFEFWKHVDGSVPVVMSENASLKVFAEANPELEQAEARAMWEKFSLARERMQEPDPKLAQCSRRYSKQKESWNLADYADLLEYYLEQMQGETFTRLHNHVLVDEVQDLTPLQLAVVKGLAGEDGKGFFAIGDPNQSIYGFRGAEPEAEGNLRKTWPDLKTITLSKSYRSGEKILTAASALFPDQSELEAIRKITAEVQLFEAPDDLREASWISDRIKGFIGATSHSMADSIGHGTMSPGDIAVLVRFKGLIPVIAKSLERRGVPCSTPETEVFWHEPRIEGILSEAGRILGLSSGNGEGPEIPETALAGGPKSLATHLKDQPTFDAFFWDSRPFSELCREFDRHGGWAGLINWVNLQSDLENVRKNAEKVQIMSLHAAKGLEFKAVFLPALEDGILPFAGKDIFSGKMNGNLSPLDLHEERRLFYVGLTRAKDQLYLSHAKTRRIYGKSLRLSRSRFLKELPEYLVEKLTMAAHTVKKEKQISLLD